MNMIIIIRTDGGLVRLEVVEARAVNLPEMTDFIDTFLLLTALIILVVNTLVIR